MMFAFCMGLTIHALSGGLQSNIWQIYLLESLGTPSNPLESLGPLESPSIPWESLRSVKIPERPSKSLGVACNPLGPAPGNPFP